MPACPTRLSTSAGWNSSAIAARLDPADCGMIAKTRMTDLRKLEGVRWATALKAPDVADLGR